jgi:hypothetical protein
MKTKICVILTAYKRTNFLITQINSLLRQSLRPDHIVIWNNSQTLFALDKFDIPITIIHSTENLGVWARFTAPLLIDSKFYCIFDDDTIPGERWLENCTITFGIERALMGTIGLTFLSNKYYEHRRFGWANPIETSTSVDIVGHSWFFDRGMIEAFWSKRALVDSPFAGEDIHFSYAIQAELGLRTIVPPHPANDLSLWGAHPEFSQSVGNDSHATSAKAGAYQRFQDALDYYLVRGFKLLHHSS